MTKEFVPYELAVKLKALGFDEKVFSYFEKGTVKIYTKSIYGWDCNTSFVTCVSRPTFSQAFRWFREKYGLFIQPNRTIDSEGIWFYFSVSTKRTDVCEGSFSYEEAELACLKKLIEIKENK
jgi:hypothetical protein